MTIEELEKVFSEIKDKKMKVIMAGYYDAEINGWYVDIKDDQKVLVLTRLNVQPRTTPET